MTADRRGLDREPQPPAQGPDRRRAQGRQARALREAHGAEPGRVPDDDQGREEGRAPSHRRLQQPLPPEAGRAPRAMAGRPLRRTGAHALPVPLSLSSRAGRLVAPRRRDVGLLGAGRHRHPLHRPAALVQRRGEDGARPPYQQGLRALRRHRRRLHRLRERCRGDHLGLDRGHHRRWVRAARQRELLHDRRRLRRHSRAP